MPTVIWLCLGQGLAFLVKTGWQPWFTVLVLCRDEFAVHSCLLFCLYGSAEGSCETCVLIDPLLDFIA